MISSVSANNVTDDGSPIAYKELQPIGDDSIVIHYGDNKYPMQNFGDAETIAKEIYAVESIESDENDTREITVFKNVIVNRTVDGNATIKIIGNENITGQIYLSFLKTPLNLTNGQIEYQLTSLKRGNYSFQYYYSGNEIYRNGTQNITFIIPSTSTIIETKDNFTMYYKDGSEIKATLKDQWGTLLTDKVVTFIINGVAYNRITDENGSASIKLNLGQGIYDITTYYPGTLTTTGNLTYTNVTILPTITGNDIKKLYKNSTQYYVKLTDNNGEALVNQTVQFNINGVFYNRTSNEEGFAKLNINLNDGTYIITAENLHDNCKISNTITVLPTIVSDDLIKIYKNASQFNAKLLKTDGSPLANSYAIFNINGVFYNRTTDSEGNVKLNINLHPGTYIITTENHYDNSKKSNIIVVTPYLFTDDLTKYYKGDSRFKAKLVDSNYNPQANKEIRFIIDGVGYIRNTDENGEASLAINLKPGEYDIITKNSEYEVTNTITVLPTLIDLNNEYVTINYNEGEKYNVYVVDGNGNPYANQTVTFKYHYYVENITTDENGIAGFEGKRMNQYLPIEIEYNGYSFRNNWVQFRMYPYAVVGDREGNILNPDPNYDPKFAPINVY